jgi:5-methylcytosine-specific restriction enzyme A
MRNPAWVRDEIILAMDLYVRAGRKQLPPGHEEVLRLSQLLNRLPIHPASVRDENFRNSNGISMILGNFLGVDPEHDQPGLTRNNQLQATIWKEFVEAPSLLQRTVEAIQAAVAAENLEESAEAIDEEDVFPEGHILTRQHVLRERNRSAVVAKIDQSWRRGGRIACEACGFDFLDFYGELGRGFAECHHVVPLAEAASSRVTRLADLAIVCANCHRMLHRARPVLTVDALRSLIVRPFLPQRGGTA